MRLQVTAIVERMAMLLQHRSTDRPNISYRELTVLVALARQAMRLDAAPESSTAAEVCNKEMNVLEKALALFPEDGGG